MLYQNLPSLLQFLPFLFFLCVFFFACDRNAQSSSCLFFEENPNFIYLGLRLVFSNFDACSGVLLRVARSGIVSNEMGIT